MPQISNHKFSLKGKIINKESRLWFYSNGIEFFLLPSVMKNLPNTNFESLEAEIKGSVSFEAKVKNRERTVILKSSEELKPVEMELEISSINFNLSGVNLVAPQSSTFQDALLKCISEDLNLEIFDDVFDQDRIPWNEDEENIALELYLECDRGRNATYLKELISSAISDGRIDRSAQAVYMKVYQYQSVDNGVSQEGLGNISKKTIENMRKFKENKSEN